MSRRITKHSRNVLVEFSLPLHEIRICNFISRSCCSGPSSILAVAPGYSLAFLLSILIRSSYIMFIRSHDRGSILLVAVLFSLGIFLQYALTMLIVALNLAMVLEILVKKGRSHCLGAGPEHRDSIGRCRYLPIVAAPVRRWRHRRGLSGSLELRKASGRMRNPSCV